MAKNVFIIGAGASRECGAPLMMDFLDAAQDLSVGSDDQQWRQDVELVLQAESALRPTYANANLQLRNIESLWSVFEMVELLGNAPGIPNEQIPLLVPALRRIIVGTLSRTMKPRWTNSDDCGLPVPYDDFIRMYRRIYSARIITFNYDPALDIAIVSTPDSGPASARHSRAEDKALDAANAQVLKLHGSLNWAGCTNPNCPTITCCGWSDEWSALRVGLSLARHNCVTCGSQCRSDPVIVPPAWSKRDGHMALQQVWQTAATTIARARNLFVIGYSLPPSDRFFRNLFGIAAGSRLRRIWVFDPDAEGVERRWREFLGPGAAAYLKSFPLRFSEAIGPIGGLMHSDDQLD